MSSDRGLADINVRVSHTEYSLAARPREETRILDGYRGLSPSYVHNITTLCADIFLCRTSRATFRRDSIVAGGPSRAFPVCPPNLRALTSANGMHLHTLDYCIVSQDTRLEPQALQLWPTANMGRISPSYPS